MKPFKIGIDAQAIGTNFSGNEVYIKNILKHFEPDVDMEYILYLNKNYSYSGDGYNQFNKKIFKFRSPFIRLPIEFPIRTFHDKLDLLHVQYTSPIFVNCPVITTIHDISFEHYPEYFTKKEVLFLKQGVRRTAALASKIITVSEYSKLDLIETYNIPNEKIVVTYNSIDSSFKVIDEDTRIAQIKEKYNIQDDFLLAVGNLQPRKNIPRLLEAYRKIRLENSDFNLKLVIVGRKAWLWDEIFRIMSGFDFIDDVILTGFVSNEDLPLLYNAARIFVYPSLFEGFGLPIIESMACGTPVVTSNTSCLPEIANGAALLVDPLSIESIAENIYKLWSDRTLYEQLRTKGLERASSFNWENSSKQTVDVYKLVLSR